VIPKKNKESSFFKLLEHQCKVTVEQIKKIRKGGELDICVHKKKRKAEKEAKLA
jgi:hypothetical protein